MGAWDYGIFDDDTAYFFQEEIEANPKEFFQQSFQTAIDADYLEYDECQMVTVSAAYLDNYINETKYRTDCDEDNDMGNVNLFRSLYQGPSLDNLRTIAVQALRIVIGEESELNELWAENEELYPKWKGSILALIARLES